MTPFSGQIHLTVYVRPPEGEADGEEDGHGDEEGLEAMVEKPPGCSPPRVLPAPRPRRVASPSLLARRRDRPLCRLRLSRERGLVFPAGGTR